MHELRKLSKAPEMIRKHMINLESEHKRPESERKWSESARKNRKVNAREPKAHAKPESEHKGTESARKNRRVNTRDPKAHAKTGKHTQLLQCQINLKKIVLYSNKPSLMTTNTY